jgi:hypothetical protein
MLQFFRTWRRTPNDPCCGGLKAITAEHKSAAINLEAIVLYLFGSLTSARKNEEIERYRQGRILL